MSVTLKLPTDMKLRIQFWLGCGLDAVQEVVCEHEGSDQTKVKPGDITSEMVDGLLEKCPNLRRIRAVQPNNDYGYSYAKTQTVWECDRETGLKTVSIFEHKSASFSDIIQGKLESPSSQLVRIPGWTVRYNLAINLVQGDRTPLAGEFNAAWSSIPPGINAVLICDTRLTLDDLARLLTTRNALANGREKVVLINHVQACRVGYDIRQFVSFAEAVGPSLKILQLRDWDEQNAFPPSWGMARPGISLMDLGDLIDAIHDNMPILEGVSFVMSGFIENSVNVMLDEYTRLSDRPYLPNNRVLQKIHITFSEVFGGDPATAFVHLPLIAIARNLAVIANERTRVNLQCVTSSTPHRALPVQSALLTRLIQYFRA